MIFVLLTFVPHENARAVRATANPPQNWARFAPKRTRPWDVVRLRLARGLIFRPHRHGQTTCVHLRWPVGDIPTQTDLNCRFRSTHRENGEISSLAVRRIVIGLSVPTHSRPKFEFELRRRVEKVSLIACPEPGCQP
jgi:hypothetical protein